MDVRNRLVSGRTVRFSQWVWKPRTAAARTTFVLAAVAASLLLTAGSNSAPGSSERIAVADYAGLHLVDATSGRVRHLDVRFEHISDVEWSPDGKRLLFAAGADADRTGIYIFSLGSRRLATVVPAGDRREPAGGVGAPVWSPTGREIAYSDLSGGLYVVRLGGSRRIVLPQSPDSWVRAIHWSPDGRIFIVGSDGRLRSVRSDGTDRRIYARGLPREAVNPSLSRDGRRGVFTRGEDLFVRDVDGESSTRLTRTRSWREGPAVFSPDGSSVAYVVLDCSRPGPSCRLGGLWRVDVRSLSRRRVAAGVGDGDWVSISWGPAA